MHLCIKHSLKNLQRGILVLPADDIISITIDRMREDFRSSRTRRYRMNPKTCALFEHEYETPISDDEWKRMADDVKVCLRNFYGSEMFASLKDIPRQNWLEIEDFSFFYLTGKKIWAVIDCSFRTENGVTIIDWKTGRGTTSDLSLQLSCYAMYGMERWGIKPEKIKLIEYNLLSDQRSEFHITESEISDIKSYIRGSITDMESLLLDVKNNTPKEERFFEKVENEKIREKCNFKKVCAGYN